MDQMAIRAALEQLSEEQLVDILCLIRSLKNECNEEHPAASQQGDQTAQG